ncbi:MAG: phytanoyl-CoA dioxygenase family protein [Phycisphaeraceae bacterium]
MNLQHFQEHGYQLLPNVIDRGVIERLLEFLAADADDALTLLMADLRIRRMEELAAKVDETFARPDFESVPKDQRLVMSGHFPLETRLSRTLWMVPKLPRVREVVEEALKHAELYMHLPPSARFVLPHNKHAAVPAHQDVSYNQPMSDFVTLWVPLVPIDDACGGIDVFEGSGQPVERLDDRSQKFWLNGVVTEGFNRKHCTMDVGDALLLNKWIVHESHANVSKRIRFSIDFRFFSGRDASSKHLLDMQTWKVIEPGRKVVAA